MKPENARVIESLASSIADGAPVDWDAAGSALGAEEQRLLRHLKLIGTLADVYRSLPSDPDAAPGDDDRLADPEPAGPRWGRLILLDRIGHGTSADVFRAWDVDLQREVALKLLRLDGVTADAAANARMLQEARRIARVRHPHVVHVYGAERHEERIGLWMELVRGRSLDEIVRTDGPLAAQPAAQIGADLCGAVAAVHAAGLLHRDIKAQNVIRDDSGRIVLMDFGAGEEIGAGPRVAGTPLYIAPEVLAGGSASAASDVYALGVLLFYLTTGTFPVQAASFEDLQRAHRSGERRSLREVNANVPAAFARVVDRALSANPAARFATAAAMEAELRRLARGETGTREGARWRGWLAAGATAAAVVALLATLSPWRTSSSRPVADATAIAVLPLTFVSGDPEARFLADGLTEELITTLGQVKALQVTAHTSVRRFRGTTEPVSSIAEQLGVGSVLEGAIAVQPGADARVRVNMRLIRAGTDVQLWSDSFERPLANLLALERHIARAVTESVRGVLTPQESARFAQRAGTSGAAQRAYLEALSYRAQNRRGAEVRPALDALLRAVALDPDFAAAHAAVARTNILLAGDGEIPQAQAYAAARAAADRALALDPGLADAHVALADVSFYYEWDWPAAEAEYLRAIELSGSDVWARRQYANLLAAMGRPDDARQHADRAVALDPLTPDVLLGAGVIAYYQRRYDEAREIVRRVTLMDPRFPGAYRMLARIEEARGNIAGAIEHTNRALELSDYVPARAAALSLQAQAGQRAQAREGLMQLRSRLAAENRPLNPAYEAYVRLALGEREAAFDLLAKAVAARDQTILLMRVDPRLDSLRSDPRFQGLLDMLGRP